MERHHIRQPEWTSCCGGAVMARAVDLPGPRGSRRACSPETGSLMSETRRDPVVMTRGQRTFGDFIPCVYCVDILTSMTCRRDRKVTRHFPSEKWPKLRVEREVAQTTSTGRTSRSVRADGYIGHLCGLLSMDSCLMRQFATHRRQRRDHPVDQFPLPSSCHTHMASLTHEHHPT